MIRNSRPPPRGMVMVPSSPPLWMWVGVGGFMKTKEKHSKNTGKAWETHRSHTKNVRKHKKNIGKPWEKHRKHMKTSGNIEKT